MTSKENNHQDTKAPRENKAETGSKRRMHPVARVALTVSIVAYGLSLLALITLRSGSDISDVLFQVYPLLGLAGISIGIVGYLTLLAVKKLPASRWPFTVAIILALLALMCPRPVPGPRVKVSRVKADLRSLAIAVEAYFEDHGRYPEWAQGERGANRWAPKTSGAYRIHTFRHWRNEQERRTLTLLSTPIAYITRYFEDPFADTKGATFGYYSDGEGWIVYSWGRDRDENKPEEWDLEPDVEKVYHSDVDQPSETLIFGHSSAPAHHAYTFDPTNGAISPGDVWRVKQ